MKKLTGLLLLATACAPIDELVEVPLEQSIVAEYHGDHLVNEWRQHEVAVRDGLLEWDSIDSLTYEALGSVHDHYFLTHEFRPELSAFPLQADVEVRPWFMGYNWDFKQSMEEKKGHPAYDIFADSGMVVAPMDGVVISVNGEWSPGSDNTGGLSVGMYNPSSGMLQYYAHLGSILVEQGDVVRAGTPLGEIGRTGTKAAEDRSPTHLHLTTLTTNIVGNRIQPFPDGDILKPLRIYDRLMELK